MKLQIIAATFALIVCQSQAALDPDTQREVPDLILSRGYQLETHNIVTQDGYILTCHRIINDKYVGTRKRTIMVQHGLLSSGRDFIINSPGGGYEEFLNDGNKVIGNNLGFELAKRGYDVWLTNSRGNTWGRNHTTLCTDENKFWDFSFDEMIAFDVPATIDHILKATNATNIGYVGHSQGTLVAFGLLSQFPKYNDILKPFIALSPITSVGYMTSPIVRFLAKVPLVLTLFKRYTGPFLPSNAVYQYLVKHMCHSPIKLVCSNILFLACGFPESKQLNISRIGVYSHGAPAGTSAKNVAHFGQSVNSRRFAFYDYGLNGNLEKYNQREPPLYELEKITNKHIYLVTADTDWFSNPSEINKLRGRLRAVKPVEFRIKAKVWTHCDYIFATSAGETVNRFVINTLEKYEQPTIPSSSYSLHKNNTD